jgi:TPR repeat protein
MPTGTFVNASKTEESSSSMGQAATPDEKASPTTAADRSEQQVQAGQSELAAAQGYLNGASGNRDSGKAARLLWAAVGNGNSTAEVLLADLYIRGDGVAKNCEQGRILLVAAIKSGSMEAQQKLTNLNATGCKQ